MAVQSGLPIVPVSVVGSRHVMQKGRLMTCPGEVELIVHAPIPTHGLTRRDVGALTERAHAVVTATVSARGPTVDALNLGTPPPSPDRLEVEK